MDSPLVSLWFTVRGAAGDGGQTRGWLAQHEAGDLWDQPRDPEAEIWDWPRQEAGMEGSTEQKSIVSFLYHQVSSTIMWEISGNWGKSRERRPCISSLGEFPQVREMEPNSRAGNKLKIGWISTGHWDKGTVYRHWNEIPQGEWLSW